MSTRRQQRPSVHRVGFLALLVAVAALAATVSAPPVEAAPLRLAVSPGAAVAGETMTFSGGVPATGTRRVVVLQRRTGSGWVDVVRSRASTTGVVRLASAARSTTTSYRVLAPATKVGRKSYRVVATPTVQVTSQAQSGTLALHADRARLVSTFQPSRAGRPVALERRASDGSWRAAANGVQDARGTTIFSVDLDGATTTTFRARTGTRRGAPAFATPTLTVPGSTGIVGSITKVSVSPSGVPAEGFHRSSVVSGNGRYVVYSTTSKVLVDDPAVDGKTQLYRWDRQTGTSRLITRGAIGDPANGQPASAVTSHDGRFVAFQSLATNQTVGEEADDGRSDTYLWDAATDEIVWVSRSTRTSEGSTSTPSISSDGRYVLFDAQPSAHVVGDDAGVGGPMRWDRLDGSIEYAIGQGEKVRTGDVGPAKLAAGGRHVLFRLGSRPAVWDSLTGTETVLESRQGGVDPDISGDGRFVVYVGNDELVEPGIDPLLSHIFLWDVVDGTLSLVSRGPSGPADGPSELPRISTDGQWVSFVSEARNLQADDTRDDDQVYLWGRAGRTVDLISRGHDGRPAGGLNIFRVSPGPTIMAPSISGDGRQVSFQTASDDYFPEPRTVDTEVLLWSR